MEIFTYAPNWAAIERRKEMKMTQAEERAQRLPLHNDRFHYKKESKNKVEDVLCSICKKEDHLPAMCPERKVEVKEKKEDNIYTPMFQFTPTTVRLTNVPVDTVKGEIREILISNNVQYDLLIMVTDKQNREDFKGTVYIELPTEGMADRCVALFDRMKMGVQIVSACTVEGRQRA
ncbi:hypothetical protein NEAUS04_1914 [Nematocida ausubeli]|uniref:Uncharacterized protein n=1 Tax=Nematocida ausubeli (strain ATCC PRA-371 / ERTm2) TaxID=1913371 RepID=H8ZEC9_NEMA1|nr:uncharacterized protein NESG_01706 [Nematocida ausubeli]EHY64894.1 hypothetical protein NERG_01950 [Nematocida ausubeli]KAI5135585.1 hypothetical protein NEAUS06_1553 [Nematocida ausubeli]KAI5137559.1 hypothetical protein NEAUS07_2027 [Nematocida ausubeli]KAI5150137.1 hypothetical protein NEAUS05_2046 [Nematocida ausubeli]KAI5160578.1 hypothetical protein NEAUS03_1226 [Nematocida ausubeli]